MKCIPQKLIYFYLIFFMFNMSADQIPLQKNY